jgi:hypothetical protein
MISNDGAVAVVTEWGATYGELHAFSARCSQLSANNHLAALGTALHDEPQNTVASSPHRETIKKLVPERFALRYGRETASLHLCSIEGDGVFRELEALLDERGELADPAALVAEDFLSVCGSDDFFSRKISVAGRGDGIM